MEYHPEDNGYNARISRLETSVAELRGQLAGLRTQTTPDIAVKEQAAAQQATQHLYAPLRSDVRALTELAAFARSVAYMPPPPDLISSARALAALVERARALLKDMT